MSTSAKQPITTRFNTAHPCPVCESGSKGCSATADGLHLCRGEPADPSGWADVSKGTPDAAGFLHHRRRDHPRPTFSPPPTNKPKDWSAFASRFAVTLDLDRRQELVAALRLPVEALAALPLLGWKADEGCWTFPEFDPAGNVVGINRRFADGTKKVMSGGNRGLTLPTGWRERSGTVFVVEGASDTLAMTHAGLCCVGRPSNSGGVEHLTVLLAGWSKDRGIVVIGENDAKPNGQWPGKDGAVKVASALTGQLGRPVPVAFPPADAKDVRQWLTSPERANTHWPERGAELVNVLVNTIGPADAPPAPPPWPDPPAGEAYHGLFGRIVRTLEPHTEADPVALLVQLLILFGNVVARGPYFTVEATRHYTNEFVVLVGNSSRARKGTSKDRVTALFAGLDGDWLNERVSGGLSSSEGLIHAVRDPLDDDDGEADKRLCATEAEWSSVLKQAERTGNTLTELLRQLWDGQHVIGNKTVNPRKATGAHVSVIAHTTTADLTRYLTGTDAANGYGNRHLFVCVKRSQLLPWGGCTPESELEVLREQLHAAAGFAQHTGEVGIAPAARPLWEAAYRVLEGERGGLAGALTARGSAHVRRLAMLYALADCSATVRPVHLMAALALWDYAERSVIHLFGDKIGNPLADEIKLLLVNAPNGMTREEIVRALGNHQYGERLTKALAELKAVGQARVQSVATGGRPAERWTACHPTPGTSSLMTIARDVFCSCDESDESDESPPDTLFRRFRRFDRTPDPVFGKKSACEGAPPERPHTPTPNETWLVQQLWHGPRTLADLDARAKAAGVTHWKKYADPLHIVRREQSGGVWEWELPAGLNRNVYPKPLDPPPPPPEPTLFVGEPDTPDEPIKPKAKSKQRKPKSKSTSK